MKKILNLKRISILMVLVFTLTVLVGCFDNSKFAAKTDGSITVVVMDPKEEVEVFKEEIKFTKGDTLVELLQDYDSLHFTGETENSDFIITSVFGLEANSYDKQFWDFKVNDVASKVAISKTALVDKDVITFTIKIVRSFTVIVINYEDVEIFNKEIEYDKGDNLLELLMGHEELLVVGTTSAYGFYITSIKGIASEDYSNAFWNFKVNGVDSMVGVGSTDLADGDVYTFALIKW